MTGALAVRGLSLHRHDRACRITVVLVGGPSGEPILPALVERSARLTNRRPNPATRNKQCFIELLRECLGRVGGNLPRGADIIRDSPFAEFVSKTCDQVARRAAANI